jgi:hypothetical protein
MKIHRGICYFDTRAQAQEAAAFYPGSRVIAYERGHAVQIQVSGAYVGLNHERARFHAAFRAIIARGEKPTPGALNIEQGFDVRRAIPGRLSAYRIEMLEAEGYAMQPNGRYEKGQDDS